MFREYIENRNFIKFLGFRTFPECIENTESLENVTETENQTLHSVSNCSQNIPGTECIFTIKTSTTLQFESVPRKYREQKFHSHSKIKNVPGIYREHKQFECINTWHLPVVSHQVYPAVPIHPCSSSSSPNNGLEVVSEAHGVSHFRIHSLEDSHHEYPAEVKHPFSSLVPPTNSTVGSHTSSHGL